MTYIIVAFRHDQERSTLYKKVHTLEACFKAIEAAEKGGATFLSLRFIRS